MSNWAVVVGIESYASNGIRSLVGPALDALRFALWVNAQGVPSNQIVLLIKKGPGWTDALAVEYDRVLALVIAKGIQPVQATSREQIESAIYQTSLTGANAYGDLYVYWSGHGVTFPKSAGEAVLCPNLDSLGETDYIYLSELSDGLRTRKFARFRNQRLIVDACATHVVLKNVGNTSGRAARLFEPDLEPDQILMTAVPRGEDAIAEPGGSLFTRVLLEQLEKTGSWPLKIADFFAELEAAILPQVLNEKVTPRLIRYRSPGGGDEIRISGPARMDRIRPILQALLKCNIVPSAYRPIYVRVTGYLPNDPGRLLASGLSAILDELDLNPDPLYGGQSRAMIEFLLRVIRLYPQDSEPLQTWLAPLYPAGRKEIEIELDRESKAWNLAIVLQEPELTPEVEGEQAFPVEMTAFLWEQGSKKLVDHWPPPNLAPKSLLHQASLREALRRLIVEARTKALHSDVELRVHIFANPPLFDQLYHDLPSDPDEDEEDVQILGEFCPFVLRSRHRLTLRGTYKIEAWRAKSRALQEQPGKGIKRHAATGKREERDLVANLDGLLLMREAMAGMGTQSFRKSEGYKLLRFALKQGLPLITWRVAAPADGDWEAAEQHLAAMIQDCKSIEDVPERLREARGKKSENWSRAIAFMWDEAGTVPYHFMSDPS